MKFKLTKKTKEYLGITLYQIEALKSFGNVEKGEKGGWVEKEDNLSQDGNAWIYGDARVFGNAEVKGFSVLMNGLDDADDEIIKKVCKEIISYLKFKEE